ncbi:unnamed protein product [Anisakis simplex]|uniref:Uncharacterized protein n=1 Tax=Anisakis simplex TaxID=6269 RepID=A0A0M3KFD8_ANISI|nr:unnamed protein product [Anisakis simplex]
MIVVRKEFVLLITALVIVSQVNSKPVAADDHIQLVPWDSDSLPAPRSYEKAIKEAQEMEMESMLHGRSKRSVPEEGDRPVPRILRKFEYGAVEGEEQQPVPREQLVSGLIEKFKRGTLEEEGEQPVMGLIGKFKRNVREGEGEEPHMYKLK